MSLMSRRPVANPVSMATGRTNRHDLPAYLCIMPGNSIGSAYRLTTFGESHGPALGGIIDGVPAGVLIDFDRIQAELDRRRPGQSADHPTQGKRRRHFPVRPARRPHDGTPIGFTVPNGDQRGGDYDHLQDRYRPSHADYTYDAKYGFRDVRGGGRASARRTVAVIGGAVARQVLEQMRTRMPIRKCPPTSSACRTSACPMRRPSIPMTSSTRPRYAAHIRTRPSA